MTQIIALPLLSLVSVGTASTVPIPAPTPTPTPSPGNIDRDCEGDERIRNEALCNSYQGCTWNQASFLNDGNGCHCNDFQGCCLAGGCWHARDGTSKADLYYHSCSDYNVHVDCCETTVPYDVNDPERNHTNIVPSDCPGTCDSFVSGVCNMSSNFQPYLLQSGCWIGFFHSKCNHLLLSSCLEPRTYKMLNTIVPNGLIVFNGSHATVSTGGLHSGQNCTMAANSYSGVSSSVNRHNRPASPEGFSRLQEKACNGTTFHSSLQDALESCRSSTNCFGVHEVGCSSMLMSTTYATCGGQDFTHWHDSLQCCQEDCVYVKEQR